MISNSVQSPRRVLVIAGPTCSGKSALAVAIARRVPAEIVSADSRQIYRMMDIGTAKPPPAVLREIPHHFINIADPDEEYSAGRFGIEGRKAIEEIFSRGRLSIVAGGSGLYIRSLVDGIFEGAGKNPAIRAQLEQRFETEGARALVKELDAIDAPAAAMMNPPNRRRLIRALEVFYATGLPISEWQQKTIETDFTPVFVGLRWERARLYAMIDERVDAMMAAGLLEEVRAIAAHGYSVPLNALNTPGYKELFAFLRGKIALERAVALIKQHTRNYAKRQLTWFNAEPRMQWFDMQDFAEIESLAGRLALEMREA